MKRALRYLLNSLIALGVLILALMACFPLFNLHLNTSDSLPRGIYRQIRDGADGIRRGDIVRFCLSGEAASLTKSRGYVDTPFPDTGCELYLRPLMKPVVALPGDVVAIDGGGVSVNGERIANSRRMAEDGLHRAMPEPAATGVVADGTVWVISGHHPFSWDSRYYGAIPLANVRGIVRPFILWSDL